MRYYFPGIKVAVMKDPYALKLAFFIQIVEHILVHDYNVALFPLSARGARRRSSQNIKLGNKFDTELPAPGKESPLHLKLHACWQ